MPITSDDIKFYLSGGETNSNPNLSLGGDISNTEIANATLHNLFDRVLGDESYTGDTEYRAFYVKNTHASLTWEGVKVWIDTNTPAGDTIEIGIESSKGSPKQSIANENTAPTGITFSAPSNKENGLNLGDLLPGDVYMIWVKRIVPPSTAAYNTNYFILKFEGDTAA